LINAVSFEDPHEIAREGFGTSHLICREDMQNSQRPLLSVPAREA
jgi:hypothetical protein